MSYEKNCAVAEKLGYYIHKQNTRACLVDKGEGYIPSMKHFDPCNDPRDYMKLAFDNCISIIPCKEGDSMWCALNPDGVPIKVYPLLPEMIGEMVVDAFLQMETTK